MSWLGESWRRMKMLFHRDQFDREMDEEMRLHRDLREQEISKEAVAESRTEKRARYAAQQRFGNELQLRERSREMWGWKWLEDAVHDIRYGLRILRKSPGFAAVAILTLALGIGANTAVFSVVNSVLLRPLPYPDADRLAVIYAGVGNADRAPHSRFEVYQIRQRTKEFDQVGGMWVTNGTLPGDGDPEQVKLGVVTANFLPMLCPKPELGRFFNASDEDPKAPWAIVISHGVWARRFGSNPAIVGQSVRFGQASAVVIGVMPQNFRFVFPGDSNVPANVDVFYTVPIDDSEPTGPGFLHLIGRLSRGSTFASAQAEADAIAKQVKAFDSNPAVHDFRLHVFSLQGDDVKDVRGTLLLLFGGVGLVLLIGCANVANLLMARATKRSRETTVRAALGASSGRLVRQFLTENLCLGGLGGVAALGVGWAAMRAILSAQPPSLVRFNDVRIDLRVLAFTFAAALLTSALFGLAPMIAASRLDLVQSLKEAGRSASKAARRWSGLLVSAEVALGFVLLASTGLLLRTFVNILQVDPGFHAENVFSFQIPSPKYEMLHELQANLAALPGVVSVSAVSHLPLDGTANWYAEYWKEGATVEQQHSSMVDYRSILPGYFATVGATLLQGRDFTDSDDAAHQHVAIIDEVLAKELWPDGSAIGQKLNVSDSPKGPYQFERDWAVVVGVVRHIQCHSLTAIVRPQVYVPYPLAPRPVSVVMRTGGPVAGLAYEAREQVALLNKTMPVSRVAPLTEVVARARSESRFATLLAISLSFIALLLACIGIYGVLSYSVTQRTSEIGVRMALGARRTDVMRMILADGFAPVLLGLAAGLALSFALMPLMSRFLFGVSPRSPVNYLINFAVVLMVSAFASSLPARRAMKVDPLTALRYE